MRQHRSWVASAHHAQGSICRTRKSSASTARWCTPAPSQQRLSPSCGSASTTAPAPVKRIAVVRHSRSRLWMTGSARSSARPRSTRAITAWSCAVSISRSLMTPCSSISRVRVGPCKNRRRLCHLRGWRQTSARSRVWSQFCSVGGALCHLGHGVSIDRVPQSTY